MYLLALFFIIHTSFADYYQINYQDAQSNTIPYYQVLQQTGTEYAVYQNNNLDNKISSGGFLANWNTPVYVAQSNYMYSNNMQYTLQSGVMQNIPPAYNSGQDYSYNNCYQINSDGKRSRRAITGLPYYQSCDYYGSSVNTVYPEILIIVDNLIFSHFGNDIYKTVEYVVSFWKQVDVRFGYLRNPGVLINIAGIVLLQDQLPFSYYQSSYSHNFVLEQFGRFLFNQNNFKFRTDYDIAVLMTGNNLMHTGYNSDVGGVAFTGGACKQVSDIIYSSAIIKDDGNFGGVISATHEVAHTLGAYHDGDPGDPSQDLPGAYECSPEYGYIMSPISINRHQLQFSACSQRSIMYNLNRESTNCLRNYPSVRSGVSSGGAFQTLLTLK